MFFHSTKDEVVPFCNYESVKSTWGIDHIQGHPYVSKTCLHVASAAAFLVTYVNDYVYPLLKGWVPVGEKEVGGLLF